MMALRLVVALAFITSIPSSTGRCVEVSNIQSMTGKLPGTDAPLPVTDERGGAESPARKMPVPVGFQWTPFTVALVAGVPVLFVMFLALMAYRLWPGAPRQEELDAKDGQQGQGILSVIGRILEIGIPSAIIMTLLMLNEVAHLVLVGCVGTTADIAAMGTGHMIQEVYIAGGIAAALGTLVSQAVGAGQQQSAAYWLQRGRCIISLQLIWIIPLLFFSEQILTLMGQDLEVARHTGECNRAAEWGLFSLFNYMTVMNYLQNMNEAEASALIAVVCTIIHVPVCAFLVIWLGWGNCGCGVANCLTWTLMNVCAAGAATIGENTACRLCVLRLQALADNSHKRVSSSSLLSGKRYTSSRSLRTML